MWRTASQSWSNASHFADQPHKPLLSGLVRRLAGQGPTYLVCTKHTSGPIYYNFVRISDNLHVKAAQYDQTAKGSALKCTVGPRAPDIGQHGKHICCNAPRPCTIEAITYTRL